MHYLVYVFTEDPSKEAIEEALSPHGDGKEWDWYQIGGRWTGHLSGCNPADNPANYEPCEFCEATGVTTKAVGERYPAYASNVGRECFQCNGKSKRLKWPTEWVSQQETFKVADVLSKLTEPPYAFVSSKDYDWFCRETYHPYVGLTYEEAQAKGLSFQPTPGYNDNFNATVQKFMDGFVTVVDCHN